MVPATSDLGGTDQIFCPGGASFKGCPIPKALSTQYAFCLKIQPLEGINVQMDKNSTCPRQKKGGGHELGLSCHLRLCHRVSYTICKGYGPRSSARGLLEHVRHQSQLLTQSQ